MVEEILRSYSEDIRVKVDPNGFEAILADWSSFFSYKTIIYRLFLDYMLACT